MGYLELRIPIHMPELADITAQLADLKEEVMAVSDNFDSYRTEVGGKFDAIDDAMEALRAEVAAGNDARTQLEALDAKITEARAAVEQVDPDDPSGDDAAPVDPSPTPTPEPTPDNPAV
jgi:chromosome segregation ATPase